MSKVIAATAVAVTLSTIPACDARDIPNDCRVAIDIVFADKSPAVRDRMKQIAWRESRWQPGARNGQHYGCLQIATGVHAARIRAHGFTSGDMLLAGPNVVIARSLYNEQGFRPWAM